MDRDEKSTHSSSGRELERFVHELGGRIARTREEVLRFSKTEMADRLGVGYSTQERYEKGERVPEAWYLRKLSDVSGVSIEYLVAGRGPQMVADTVAEPRARYAVGAPVEVNGLTRAIVAVETRLKDVELSAGKRARLIALVYNDVIERGQIDAQRIDQLVELVK